MSNRAGLEGAFIDLATFGPLESQMYGPPINLTIKNTEASSLVSKPTSSGRISIPGYTNIIIILILILIIFFWIQSPKKSLIEKKDFLFFLKNKY